MTLDQIEELRGLVYEAYLLFYSLGAQQEVLDQYKAGMLGRPLPYATLMLPEVFAWTDRLNPKS